ERGHAAVPGIGRIALGRIRSRRPDARARRAEHPRGRAGRRPQLVPPHAAHARGDDRRFPDPDGAAERGATRTTRLTDPLTRTGQIDHHGASDTVGVMAEGKLPLIEVGFQVFAKDGGEEFGAVRDVVPGGRPEIVVYIENSHEYTIPLSAITAVHSE